MKVLEIGYYEDELRSLLGVDALDLSDDEINKSMVCDLSEAIVLKRLTDYTLITDETELLFLKNAILAQVAATVCPSFARKLNEEVSTLDIKWKKAKINWDRKKDEFLALVEEMLGYITSTDVSSIDSYSIVDYVRNTRYPIGTNPSATST